MFITSWSSPLWISIFLPYQLNKRKKNKLWIFLERVWPFRGFLCQGNKCMQLQNSFIFFQACAGALAPKFLMLTCTKYQLIPVNWPMNIWTVIVFCHSHLQSSLSNSRRHLPNADVIPNVKSKIIISRQHFFAKVIFSVISIIQNYYDKATENSLYPQNMCLLHISRSFKDIFNYIFFTLYL